MAAAASSGDISLSARPGGEEPPPVVAVLRNFGLAHAGNVDTAGEEPRRSLDDGGDSSWHVGEDGSPPLALAHSGALLSLLIKPAPIFFCPPDLKCLLFSLLVFWAIPAQEGMEATFFDDASNNRAPRKLLPPTIFQVFLGFPSDKSIMPSPFKLSSVHAALLDSR